MIKTLEVVPSPVMSSWDKKQWEHVNCIHSNETISSDNDSSLDSEDDFCSGSFSRQQQSFWRLPSPGRSCKTNNWYSWVQTIYQNSIYSPYLGCCYTSNQWCCWVLNLLQKKYIIWQWVKLTGLKTPPHPPLPLPCMYQQINLVLKGYLLSLIQHIQYYPIW